MALACGTNLNGTNSKLKEIMKIKLKKKYTIPQAKQIKKSQRAKLKKKTLDEKPLCGHLNSRTTNNEHSATHGKWVCGATVRHCVIRTLVSHSSNSIICCCLGKRSGTPQSFCKRFYLFIQIAAQIRRRTHTQRSASSHSHTKIFNPAHTHPCLRHIGKFRAFS